MKKYTKGFTLIELLVVIAIIGILASVVLASLSTARNKGADAAVKGAMASMRNQAELYYSDHGNSYGAGGVLCSTDVFSSSTAIVANVTQNAVAAPACADTSSAWAASAQLKGGGYFCVDSTGAATTTGASSGTNTSC
jgi:prepilin-type N-terminal cleavage/methylation domain-containing protein